MQFYHNHQKLIRRVLSVVVPSHSLRYKIRTILKADCGILTWIREARKICASSKSFCNQHPDLPLWAICAIVKNEAPYLREWIEYYKIHGVDKIYIYDNESTDDTVDILRPYINSGLVKYKFWSGKQQQLVAYADCIRVHAHHVKWIAFVDLDEFIVPSAKCSIRQMLEKMPHCVGQIAMPWLGFGSNGHINKPHGLVIESYTKRGSKISNRKSIVNPRVVYAPFVHVGDVANRTMFPKATQIKVNHYYCKSWQEYKRRKTRGDALLGDKFAKDTFNKADFDQHDFNDIVDTDILRYLGQLKAALG